MRGKAPASPLSRCALGLALGAAFAGCAGGGPAAAGAPSRRGALRLAGAGDGARATVFEVKADDAASPAAIDALRLAPGRAREPLYLWIDVGRNPRLARERPAWVAGMGAHEDWRRRFPGAPRPGPGERIGIHPWTPIWYREVLEDRRAAIAALLRGRTEGIAGVFVNQVQGAPSACGCGNDQCRWTVDYLLPGGPERVEGAPAALLVAALRREVPQVQWIPVWVIECEEHDMPGSGSTGYCGGVGCFEGLCWKESTKEIAALLEATDGPIGLLAPEAAFGRRLARYEASGGWVAEAVRDLLEIPAAHGRPGIPAGRIIAVVEGEGPGAAEVGALERGVLGLGVHGVLVSAGPFDEGWEPRVVPAASRADGSRAAPAGHGHEGRP